MGRQARTESLAASVYQLKHLPRQHMKVTSMRPGLQGKLLFKYAMFAGNQFQSCIHLVGLVVMAVTCHASDSGSHPRSRSALVSVVIANAYSSAQVVDVRQ